MRICLVSAEKRVERLVRETVAGFPEFEYNHAPKSADEIWGADLYIRDYVGAESMPRDLETASAQSLFLVDREQLAEFHERVAHVRVSILVKPLSKAALHAALARALGPRGAARRAAPASDCRRADRDQLLECLLLASSKLQGHDVERASFLSRALDDFRAPLTAASGYCGLLIHQRLGPLNPDQAEVLGRMQRSLGRMISLSETMFQLGAGKGNEQHRPFGPNDIESCIERAVDEVLPAAEIRDIEINVQVTPHPKFPFDAALIGQVVVRLLENACRFSPSHGLIEVRGYPVTWPAPPLSAGGLPARVESAANAYRVDISDSGPAIPPQDIHRIFEQYLSSSGSQDRSGTGLGLATCKMFVATHHGEVFVECRTGGATFSFVLPLSQEDADEEPVLAASAEAGGSFEIRTDPETK